MLRSMALVTLALLTFTAPAQAQKQEYPSWVYEEMVPTGPHMRNLEQAQPIPGPRPSHWGAMGNGDQHRAGMRQYGTDPAQAERTYSRTQSLTPPRRDLPARMPTPMPDAAPPAPRQVTIQR